jgi:hypothetical protein
LGYNKIKKMEGTMEKVTKEAKRIWGLAMANKKVTIGVIIAAIIIYELATR